MMRMSMYKISLQTSSFFILLNPTIYYKFFNFLLWSQLITHTGAVWYLLNKVSYDVTAPVRSPSGDRYNRTIQSPLFHTVRCPVKLRCQSKITGAGRFKIVLREFSGQRTMHYMFNCKRHVSSALAVMQLVVAAGARVIPLFVGIWSIVFN